MRRTPFIVSLGHKESPKVWMFTHWCTATVPKDWKSSIHSNALFYAPTLGVGTPYRNPGWEQWRLSRRVVYSICNWRQRVEITNKYTGNGHLQEDDCYDKLGYCWPRWKKWSYLVAVAFVQVSMNFNTSVYPNAVKPLSVAFGIGEQEARTSQTIYLVTYSIGCELWAPWSEDLAVGRFFSSLCSSSISGKSQRHWRLTGVLLLSHVVW
jgi:hypothetical protein